MSSQAIERSIKFKATFSDRTVSTCDEEQALATVGPVEAMKLEFQDFLLGMASVQQERPGWVDVLKPNRWELLSLLIDTPVSKAEEQRILDELSWTEKIGFKLVKQRSEGRMMDIENTRSVLARAGQGKLRSLDPQQMKRMASLRTRAILMCAAIGFIFSVVPAAMENFLGYQLEVDGFKDAYWVCHTQSVLSTNGTASITADDTFEPTTPMDPGSFLCATIHVNASSCLAESNVLDNALDKTTYYPPGVSSREQTLWGRSAIQDSERERWTTIEADRFRSDRSMSHICTQCQCVVCGCAHHADGELQLNEDNKLLVWWLAFIPVMLIFSVLEVLILFYCAMSYTTQVAWALDIRLSPINADRAFVANALVRAAFELGNSNSPVLGVDPGNSSGDFKRFLLLLIYKGKVVLTGVLLKMLITYTCPLEFAYWAKPWLGIVLATVAWDAFTAYSILLQARIKGMGVYASVEIFNEIIDTFYGACQYFNCNNCHSVRLFRDINQCHTNLSIHVSPKLSLQSLCQIHRKRSPN